MANESTTTTMNDIAHSEAIEPAALDYAHDFLTIAPLCMPVDISNVSTNTWQAWRLASDMGTVADGGTSVDAEFDATEATDLSNTALDTDQVQITPSEYGVMRTLTDNVVEDSLRGIDFLNMIAMDSARILMTALEDDLASLLGDFSNTTGTSGADLTLANMSTCIINIRTRGVRAPDGLVFVLNDQQAADWENAITSTNSATAQYSGTADAFLGIRGDANAGLTNGAIGFHRGFPVFMSGLTDTANAGADVEGACFVPFTAANRPFSALALVTKREFRVRTERDESLRATEFVATQRKGGGELNDVCGETLVTDA